MSKAAPNSLRALVRGRARVYACDKLLRAWFERKWRRLIMGCSRLAMPSPSGLVLLGLLFLSGIGLAPVPVSATEDKGIAVSRGEAGPPASYRAEARACLDSDRVHARHRDQPPRVSLCPGPVVTLWVVGRGGHVLRGAQRARDVPWGGGWGKEDHLDRRPDLSSCVRR